MNKRNLTLASIITFSVILFSCQKAQMNANSTTSIDDNTTAETAFSDVYSTVMDEIDLDEAGSNMRRGDDDSDCKTVTVEEDTTIDQRIRTVDFGDGCVGKDGKTRKGKIIIDKIGRRRVAGSSVTITLDGFYVDDKAIEGTKTITVTENSEGQLVHTIAVTGGKVTDTDGTEITWESSRVRTQVEGNDTPYDRTDDAYSITGASSGVNIEGVAFTHTISTALRREAGCRFISSGIVEIVPEGLDARIMDYGDGTCDAEATLTVGDEVKTIDLKKRNGKLRKRLVKKRKKR